MDESTSLLLQRVAILRSQLCNENEIPRPDSLDALIGALEASIESLDNESAALTRDKDNLTHQNLELARKNDLLIRQKEALERQSHNLERQCKTLERHNTNLLRKNSAVERRNAELEEVRLALQTDRRRYRDLFEYHPDPSVITDTSGVVQNANQAAARLLNMPQRELRGENLLNFITAEHQKLFITLLTHLQRMQDIELCLQPRDGAPLDSSVTLSTLYDESGKPELLQWMLRDITERRRAMIALNASERRFRTIFNEANTGILLLDLDGKIVRSNRAIQEMLGYGEEELYNRMIDDLTCPDDAPITHAWALLQGNHAGQFVLENRLRRRDGQFIWTNCALSGMRDDQGQLLYLIGMIKDITLEKQSAAELAEMRRRLLESGEVERLRLAQELHDGPTQDLYSAVFTLSNLNGSITDPGASLEIHTLQERIKTVANSLRDTVSELRPPTIGNLGLERAIRSHAEKVQDAHPELEIKLHLTRDGQSLPPHTRLAFFRIYQQCMANTLRHAQASQMVIAFHATQAEISLDIWDNGKGFQIPARWVDFLREGHYGLAGIAERVQALGGDFKVESRPGSGTLVHVVAPVEPSRLD